MHLLFVRHGQDEDNAARILNGQRNRPLTVLGRQQAKHAARRLSVLAPDFIYTSPLTRAYETAMIIAELLGVRNVTNVPGLVERDFGVLTGKSYDDIDTHATKVIEAHGFKVFVEAP